MREIFRGKRIDNGEWVYGYYFCLHHNDERTHIHHFIIPLDTPLPKDRPIGDIQVEIIHETLGQCTDIPDKNGKKIFEGDILAVEQISDSIEHFESPVKCPYTVVVKWDKCSWMWETIGTARKRYLHFPEAWLFRKCEVIGNIHDNPELLKYDGD